MLQEAAAAQLRAELRGAKAARGAQAADDVEAPPLEVSQRRSRQAAGGARPTALRDLFEEKSREIP